MQRNKSNPLWNFFWLNLKRAAVLAMGVYVSFFISWRLFPAVNNRTPILIAIMFTYVVSAYVILPVAIRVAHTFLRPTHVPNYVITPDGFAGDPINISFVGTRHQIIRAMEKAGWHQADPKTIRNMIKVVKSFFLREKYKTAPFSSLYLFGRSQDLGFQKQVGDSLIRRHHFRLWACTNQVDPKFKKDVVFWRRAHDLLSKNQKLLWVGAAIQDEGLGLIRFTGQLTHGVLPNTDAERDMIVEDLQKAGVLKEVHTIDAGDPAIRDNRVIGDEMIADGDLKLCVLA